RVRRGDQSPRAGRRRSDHVVRPLAAVSRLLRQSRFLRALLQFRRGRSLGVSAGIAAVSGMDSAATRHGASGSCDRAGRAAPLRGAVGKRLCGEAVLLAWDEVSRAKRLVLTVARISEWTAPGDTDRASRPGAA